MIDKAVKRAGAALLALAAGTLAAGTAQAETPVASLPQVLPRPVAMTLKGDTLALGTRARLVSEGPVDAPTLALVRESLERLGVIEITTARALSARAGETQVVLGSGARSGLIKALGQAGGSPIAKSEGYAFASAQDKPGAALIVLAGADGDGLYYAAQTFAQIAARGTLPALSIGDYPAMAVRGTIEGFYGAPWSHADRLAQLAFLGEMKANTYIYSPKDDAYARDKWREAYPAAEFADLRALIDAARASHVRFTYALSPGLSMCYSNPEDVAAIERKFAAFAKAGVRSFYIAYDDIPYDKWNCEGDEARFGAPGPEAAGRAQAWLTNTVFAWQKATMGADAELMIVPTEYYDAKVSGYKTALQAVDPKVFIQWTGTDVVPASIAVRDAKAATKAFGRKTLLWDNYPVNDYGESTGRLLLAPYRGREGGLSGELSGILANPMNQEAASRVALTGSTAFSWNDANYDADETARFAARRLAGGDAPTARALLMLFDLENLAPTFGSQPWQPQSPQLARELDAVRDALASGTAPVQAEALQRLAGLAAQMQAAPATIRAGVTDKGFLEETGPWLEAMALWGKALAETREGLAGALARAGSAAGHFAAAQDAVKVAEALQTLPGTTRPQGAIRLGDGVLDRFIADAPGLVFVPAPAH
ncbi:beta-N-acetylglucosaminidase domain-containing protein [Novosphingobium sp. 1949]|uniref:Beta-N-acetylglucosaminidase domain-containing protein n=1 Tax=Novosphingobium organovorum TaxID=2930092 RepID=A0ABT0BEG0_9SPHN|nr:beta-N-acetylglucosaminidase domain-containing protein [Novosphingobium organovorum]MCJ2183368.1 beta-N-acetylglucosaminidase domain-containing protein [Novosphingobium organovorum]